MSKSIDNPLDASNNIVTSNPIVTNMTNNDMSVTDAHMMTPQGSGSATSGTENRDTNDGDSDYETEKVKKNERVINKPSVSASQSLVNEKVTLDSDNLAQPEYTQPEYKQWEVFIEEQVGFILPNSQRNWLWQAINRLSRKVNLSPEILLNRAKEDQSLIQEVIEAVLIPQSHFFRHQPTLNFILHYAQQSQLSKYLPKQAEYVATNEVIAAVCARSMDSNSVTEASLSPRQSIKTASTNTTISSNNNNNDKNLSEFKVWSVGCSFGQEAWSIAMTLEEASLRYKIWGLDVNKSALKHAEKGRYDLNQLDEIPQLYRKFVKIKGQYCHIIPVLKQHIKFLHYNLITLQLPDLPLVNMIVCQNVLIYFRHFEQRDILTRLVKRLEVGGYIVLAPGEASQWQHPKMMRQSDLQVNAWKKVL